MTPSELAAAIANGARDRKDADRKERSLVGVVLLPADTERPAPDPKHPAVLTASGDASKAKP